MFKIKEKSLKELNGLEIFEIRELVRSIGEKDFRGNQLFSFFHKNKRVDLTKATNLSKDFINKILSVSFINKPEIFKIYKSKSDNTEKYLILFQDNQLIESVYMEYKNHCSLCISTQSGCRMGCSFCASSKTGLSRNLSVAELLSQVYLIEKIKGKNIDNIVLMGVGEPLDNYENVLKFIRIINDTNGRNLSIRNITLSTCGIVPKIYDLANENIPINLSISLHNPFQNEREKIMKVAKVYSIDDIMNVCDYYFRKTGRRISFEYTMIKGSNDSKEHAFKIISLLKGKNCHLNLIRLNSIKGYKEISPDDSAVFIFKSFLEKYGINVTVRKRHGVDIEGACGQLRRQNIGSSDGVD